MPAFKINQDFTVGEGLMELVNAYNEEQKAIKITFIKQQNHKATYKAEPIEIFNFLFNSSTLSMDKEHSEQIFKQMVHEKRIPNLSDTDIEMILLRKNRLTENCSVLKKRQSSDLFSEFSTQVFRP